MALLLIFKFKNYELVKHSEKINIAELLRPVKLKVNYPSECYVRILRNSYRYSQDFVNLFLNEVVIFDNNKVFFSHYNNYLFQDFPEVCDILENIESSMSINSEEIYDVEGTLLQKSSVFKRKIKEPYTVGTIVNKDVKISFAWFFGTIRISEICSIPLNIGDIFILGGVANGSVLGDQGLCVKFGFIF